MKTKLIISYWHGDFLVGTFKTKKEAQEHYKENRHRYRDYAGEKHGFPYGTPCYIKTGGKK